MSSRRLRATAALVAALGWLAAPASYGAAALAEGESVGLGGVPLPGTGVGSTDRNQPTQLEPGLWRDTLGGTTGRADIHYFEYRRAIADSTVHLGVVGSSSDPDGDGVGISVVAGPEETDCGSDSQSATSGTPYGPFGAAVSVGPSEPGARDSECLTADTLQVQVDRGGSSSAEDLPIAIKVVEEAPVTTVTDLPEPAETVRYDVPADPAATSDVQPGGSFDDAPLLEPLAGGVRLDLDLLEGGSHLFRVPVTWGQQLVAGAHVPAMSQGEYEDLGYSSPGVDLRIVAPDRDLITTYADGESVSGYHGTDDLDLSVGTAPLRYLNRFAGVTPTLPGDHWVAVSVAAPDDRDPIQVPVELTVAVLGDPEGAPDHPAVVGAPGGEAGPAGYDPETPYLVADDRFAAVASGNPVPSDAADDGSWWGYRRFAGLGLGAVSLMLCGLGAWRLLARSR